VTPEEPTTTPAPTSPDFDAQVTCIAALGEPIRRTLYRYVAASAGPVNRDQAAAGAGVARHVAKFHLDKLVEDGRRCCDSTTAPDPRFARICEHQ
jgi:hypothetical protein